MDESSTISDHFDRRLIDGLYVETLVLADEARSFFDLHREAERAGLAEMDKVTFACESLKVTTRLMHVIAWLLAQRAIFNGELPASSRGDERFRLGAAAGSSADATRHISPEMAALILASEDIYQPWPGLSGNLSGVRAAGGWHRPARRATCSIALNMLSGRNRCPDVLPRSLFQHRLGATAQSEARMALAVGR